MVLRSFDSIYEDVPTEQRKNFVYFRQTHPPKYAHIDGINWAYIDNVRGDEPVLLLVGGLRVADAAWQSIPMLDDVFRVVTPTYPALNTMNELADGLAGMLDALELEQAYVLAGSFGGMLAQVFVRRHPDRVKKLVLSTTAVLDEDSQTRYQQALTMMQALSDEEMAQTAQSMMFDTMAPPAEMHAFYRAYLDELYTERLTRDELISTYHCLLDFAENHDLQPLEKSDILILESDNDATFDEATRARVRALYPHAQHFVFKGAGHSPGTSQRELYFKVVKHFFKHGTTP
ncbi:MAG: alpha/beta hydrolase [Aggregatilineales bacterium]